jgi:hypothetical protein
MNVIAALSRRANWDASAKRHCRDPLSALKSLVMSLGHKTQHEACSPGVLVAGIHAACISTQETR